MKNYTADCKLISEIYLNKMSTPLVASEVFEKSYCIFIDRSTAEKFNHAINKAGLKEQGVRVLKGAWADDATACIVIPKNLDYNAIEDELFKLPAAKKGFWGQMGMGYLGKKWSEV